MGLGTSHNTVTTGANFIPEIWSREVQKATEANLVAGKLIKRFDFEMAQKGDVLHIPKLSNLSATSKTAETAVSFSSPTEDKVDLTINKHYYIAMLFEDILNAQSAYDLEQEYKDKMSYGLAKQIDTDILALQSGLSQSVGTAGTDPSEDDVIAAVKYLDDADAPEMDRSFIMGPQTKSAMIKINRLTSGDFVGDKPVVRGWMAQRHGLNFYWTSNIPKSSGQEINLILHKDAFCAAVQKNISLKSQYVIDYLGMAHAAQVLYGVVEYRDPFGVKVLGK